MKYEIRYQHTAWGKAPSYDAALRDVRREGRVARLHVVVCPDGAYCYRSQADKDRDDTGERAFAVICRDEEEGGAS